MVSCIAIETASLVFGIISLLATSLVVMACVAMLVQLNIMTFIGAVPYMSDNKGYPSQFISYSLFANVGLAMTFAIVTISLAFSIILIKGIVSKKPHLVKAYFVYGVTKNTLSLIGGIILGFCTGIVNTLLTLLGCLIYSFILLMIRLTYVKISSSNYEQFSDHKPQQDGKYVA